MIKRTIHRLKISVEFSELVDVVKDSLEVVGTHSRLKCFIECNWNRSANTDPTTVWWNGN